MATDGIWRRQRSWTPRVTAIVPCYKAETFISDTLQSLAAQTWPELEILIGDDASPDGTLAIAEAFASTRDDTRVVARERNLGWVGNTNALMAEATGELMFFAWHDDVLLPSYVERLVAALRENPRAVLAFSDVEVLTPEGTRTVLVFDELSGARNTISRVLRMAMRPSGWWGATHGLFRADAFERSGGLKYHESGEFTAEWPWLLHLATLGEFERVPEPLCRKFFQKDSLSRTWKFGFAEESAVERAAVRTLAESGLEPVSKAIILTLVRANFLLKHRMPGVHKRVIHPLKNYFMRLFRRKW